jgi:spore maturation protein CgeB
MDIRPDLVMKTRIGYIGHFGDWHTEWGVAKALEQKAKVSRYHFPLLNQEDFIEQDFDLVLTTVPQLFSGSFWRTVDAPKIAHYFDLIVGWQGREKKYFPALDHFDLVLGTDCMNPAYRKAGINARWFMQAFDPADYYPVEAEVVREVAFIGNPYDQKRRELLATLSRRYSFERFGHKDSCRGPAHAEVCASTKIMVADNALNDRPGYWSNRVYMHLASKGFVLHPRVPELVQFFLDAHHLAYYDSPADLFDKLDYYLKRDKERDSIAEAGCELVHRKHTWTERMKEFWQILHESGLSVTRI